MKCSSPLNRDTDGDGLIDSQDPDPCGLPTVTAIPMHTSTPATGLGRGSTMVSPKDDMVMMYVPAGEFLMGSVKSDIKAQSYEKPQHKVYLDAFWIDRTEITNAQYARCVSERYCLAPSNKSSSSYESSLTRKSYYDNSVYAEYPVIYVSWQDAANYCTWAGRRLPSEAEWEKAARGMEGAIYPWGNTSPNCKLANYYDNLASSYCVNNTSAVGSYPDGASPYGVMDMAGNVQEWVNDWFRGDYYIFTYHQSSRAGDW